MAFNTQNTIVLECGGVWCEVVWKTMNPADVLTRQWKIRFHIEANTRFLRDLNLDNISWIEFRYLSPFSSSFPPKPLTIISKIINGNKREWWNYNEAVNGDTLSTLRTFSRRQKWTDETREIQETKNEGDGDEKVNDDLVLNRLKDGKVCASLILFLFLNLRGRAGVLLSDRLPYSATREVNRGRRFLEK